MWVREGMMTSTPIPHGSRRLALVLAGGGARAAYEVGVLSAIAERAPGLEFPILTGVSAGAINALYLAAHAETPSAARRSGERRVGEEGRSRGAPDHLKK